MPSLLLPHMAHRALGKNYQVPSSLQSFQLQEVYGATLPLDGGTAYIQVRTINGFSLAYVIYQVQKQLSITCECEEASGILHYVIRGSLSIPEVVAGADTYNWNDHQFGLSYCPEQFKLPLPLLPGEYHFFQVAFSFNLLSLLLRKHLSAIPSTGVQSAQPVFTAPFPIQKNIQKLLNNTLQLLYREPDEILRLHNMLLKLISSYLRVYNEQEHNQYWNQKKELLFAELEAYILDYLAIENASKLAITVLVTRTRTSLYQFKKLFREQYGVSLATFIKQKRMAKAKQLLIETVLPAGDIYQLVGYEDFSSFSRAFTNYFGYPPSRLRSR